MFLCEEACCAIARMALWLPPSLAIAYKTGLELGTVFGVRILAQIAGKIHS